MTGIQGLCIVILRHLKHQQMVTSIAWLQPSPSKWTMCRSCYHSSHQCLKKDAVCATAALQEALTMREDRNLCQIKGSRITRIQADGGGEFTKKKVQDLCWDRQYCTVLLTCTSTVFQWHGRAHGGDAQDHRTQNVETGESRQRMVVLCLSICRSHDERESTR